MYMSLFHFIHILNPILWNYLALGICLCFHCAVNWLPGNRGQAKVN